MLLANIAEIETADIRKCYARKKTPRTFCQKLSSACVIDRAEFYKMEKTVQMKQQLMEEKVKVKAAKSTVNTRKEVMGNGKGKEKVAVKVHTLQIHITDMIGGGDMLVFYIRGG
jgi:hypothetical protein